MERTYLELVPGLEVINSEISDLFGCANQGGMRRSLKTNTLVLFSDKTKLYQDREEDGVFYYTGMGKLGDQSLTFQQNKTLAKSNENNVSVHLFVAYKKQIYTYRGQYELTNEPFQERQLDEEKNNRLVWIFPLRQLINNTGVNGFTYIQSQKLGNHDSWQLHNNVAIKTADQSTFEYGETVIPKGVRSFFKSTNLKKGEEKEIVLNYQQNLLSAKIKIQENGSPRHRLKWEKQFTQLLNEYAHRVSGDIKIYFIKDIEETYKISLSHTDIVDAVYTDVIAEEIEQYGARTEGEITSYYGKKYERDPLNRELAIQIHGVTCAACQFNYEQKYGERGRDFIEIHHIKPLSSLGGSTEINPDKDLVPLCANCHRMVHRRKDHVLTIEELRGILQKDN